MKPILFSTDMVRAILEGRKTATRRVVKPQPTFFYKFGGRIADPDNPDNIAFLAMTEKNGEDTEEIYVPPYQPGDILYVRETFQIDYLSNIPGSGRIHYKADGAYSDFTFAPDRYEMMRRAQLKPGWRPNENMPREAARIFLRVTDVRVEGLQDIDNAGARAEGCDGRCEGPQDGALSDCQKVYDFSVERFSTVWNSTIKPADRALYGWAANPWVWVIEFERCEKPKDGLLFCAENNPAENPVGLLFSIILLARRGNAHTRRCTR